MTNNQEIAELLKQNVEASNRTTHAVRAIVRYAFLQISITTVTGILYAIGASTNLNSIFVPAASAVWLVGSIFAGWTARNDLKSSKVPKN
jgi:hypothetical protein